MVLRQISKISNKNNQAKITFVTFLLTSTISSTFPPRSNCCQDTRRDFTGLRSCIPSASGSSSRSTLVMKRSGSWKHVKKFYVKKFFPNTFIAVTKFQISVTFFFPRAARHFLLFSSFRINSLSTSAGSSPTSPSHSTTKSSWHCWSRASRWSRTCFTTSS